MKAALRSFLLTMFVVTLGSCCLWAQTSQAATSIGNETQMVPVDAKSAAVFPQFSARNHRYVLRPGDVLGVSFPYTPEFNQSVAVQPDGFITLRQLPDLKVTGMNLPQLRVAIQRAYSGILKNPEISIELREFEKPYFIAGGQVGKPGKYELIGDTTVSEGVAMAGGFTEAAKHSQVLLVRRVSDNQIAVKKLNLKAMMAQADMREDVHLEPGDQLFVPQNFISKLKDFVRVSLVFPFHPY